jgi:hypothetical protein
LGSDLWNLFPRLGEETEEEIGEWKAVMERGIDGREQIDVMEAESA